MDFIDSLILFLHSLSQSPLSEYEWRDLKSTSTDENEPKSSLSIIDNERKNDNSIVFKHVVICF